MTDAELDEIEKAHAAATANWHNDGRFLHGTSGLLAWFSDTSFTTLQDSANAAFAVIAHRSTPALLAEVRRLRALEAMFDRITSDRMNDADVGMLVDESVRRERERCAAILESGGRGFDIMEAAMRHGPNRALADVMRSGAEPTPFPPAYEGCDLPPMPSLEDCP